MALVRYQNNVVGYAVQTSANGSAVNGATLSLNNVSPGTLMAECAVTIVTGSVVATFKPQVSMDGTNWYDLKSINNSAAVSVSATGNIALQMPHSASAYTYFRVVGTLSGASTAAGDTTAVTYRFLKAGSAFQF